VVSSGSTAIFTEVSGDAKDGWLGDAGHLHRGVSVRFGRRDEIARQTRDGRGAGGWDDLRGLCPLVERGVTGGQGRREGGSILQR